MMAANDDGIHDEDDEDVDQYDSADEFSESADPPFLDQFPPWLISHRQRYHRTKNRTDRRTYRNALRLYQRERADQSLVTFSFDAWSRRRAPVASASSESEFQMDDTADAEPDILGNHELATRSTQSRSAAKRSSPHKAPARKMKKATRRGVVEPDPTALPPLAYAQPDLGPGFTHADSSDAADDDDEADDEADQSAVGRRVTLVFDFKPGEVVSRQWVAPSAEDPILVDNNDQRRRDKFHERTFGHKLYSSTSDTAPFKDEQAVHLWLQRCGPKRLTETMDKSVRSYEASQGLEPAYSYADTRSFDPLPDLEVLKVEIGQQDDSVFMMRLSTIFKTLVLQNPTLKKALLEESAPVRRDRAGTIELPQQGTIWGNQHGIRTRNPANGRIAYWVCEDGVHLNQAQDGTLQVDFSRGRWAKPGEKVMLKARFDSCQDDYKCSAGGAEALFVQFPFVAPDAYHSTTLAIGTNATGRDDSSAMYDVARAAMSEVNRSFTWMDHDVRPAQLVEIILVPYRFKGDGKARELGAGHGGPRCAYPCIFCLWRRDLPQNRVQRNEPAGPRTADHSMLDLEEPQEEQQVTALTRRGRRMKQVRKHRHRSYSWLQRQLHPGMKSAVLGHQHRKGFRWYKIINCCDPRRFTLETLHQNPLGINKYVMLRLRDRADRGGRARSGDNMTRLKRRFNEIISTIAQPYEQLKAGRMATWTGREFSAVLNISNMVLNLCEALRPLPSEVSDELSDAWVAIMKYNMLVKKPATTLEDRNVLNECDNFDLVRKILGPEKMKPHFMFHAGVAMQAAGAVYNDTQASESRNSWSQRFIRQGNHRDFSKDFAVGHRSAQILEHFMSGGSFVDEAGRSRRPGPKLVQILHEHASWLGLRDWTGERVQARKHADFERFSPLRDAGNRVIWWRVGKKQDAIIAWFARFFRRSKAEALYRTLRADTRYGQISILAGVKLAGRFVVYSKADKRRHPRHDLMMFTWQQAAKEHQGRLVLAFESRDSKDEKRTAIWGVFRILVRQRALDAFNRYTYELTNDYRIVGTREITGLHWLDHRCDEDYCGTVHLQKDDRQARSSAFSHIGLHTCGSAYSLGQSLALKQDDETDAQEASDY